MGFVPRGGNGWRFLGGWDHTSFSCLDRFNTVRLSSCRSRCAFYRCRTYNLPAILSQRGRRTRSCRGWRRPGRLGLTTWRKNCRGWVTVVTWFRSRRISLRASRRGSWLLVGPRRGMRNGGSFKATVASGCHFQSLDLIGSCVYPWLPGQPF